MCCWAHKEKPVRTDRGLAFVDRPGGDSTTPVSVVAGPNGPELSASPGRVAPGNTAWNASLRLKDYADVVKARSYDESELTGIIMHNLRLYYVVTDDAEAKVKELIANTPFWFTASPEFIAEIKRLLSVKYKLELADKAAPPPNRRVQRHYVHNLTMMLDGDQWKIRDGLAAPELVAPYVPRERIL